MNIALNHYLLAQAETTSSVMKFMPKILFFVSIVGAIALLIGLFLWLRTKITKKKSEWATTLLMGGMGAFIVPLLVLYMVFEEPSGIAYDSSNPLEIIIFALVMCGVSLFLLRTHRKE